MADADADLDLISRAAKEAGELALAFRERTVRVWSKAPGDPVSEADLAADALLKERLLSVRPDYGWLSEETADDRSRLTKRRAFVVDPLDGTRAYVKGRAEFAVSVAVIETGRPVCAAIYDPSSATLYAAARGAGAYRNGTRMRVSETAGIEGATILGDPGRLTSLRDMGAEAVAVNSAALRLAFAASGEYDAVVAVRAKWDWDLAAGHLLIEEAGGLMTSNTGQALRYDLDPPRQPPPLAAGPALHALLLQRLLSEQG